MDALFNFGKKAVAGVTSTVVSSVTPSEVISVNGRRFTLDEKLGEGSFAFVFRGTSPSGTACAIKRIMCPDETAVQAVNNEIKFLKLAQKHRYIVELRETQILKTRRGHEAYIVTEFCSGGTVYDLIRRAVESGRGSLAEKDVLRIFECACLALEHLHSQNPPVQHRDMKVENLLLTDRGVVLCDFGSCTTRVYTLEGSREKMEAEEDIMNNTTMSYRSPEMCDLYLGYPIDEKCDIWALGVLLYRIAFAEPPWEPNSSIAILNSKYTIPKRHKFSQELVDLIPYCLRPDPADRPDIYDVVARVAQLKGKTIGGSMASRRDGYRARRPQRAPKPKKKSSGRERSPTRSRRGHRERSPPRRRNNRRERSPPRNNARRERSPSRHEENRSQPIAAAQATVNAAPGSSTIAPNLFDMLEWQDAPAAPAAQQQVASAVPNLFASAVPQQQQQQHQQLQQSPSAMFPHQQAFPAAPPSSPSVTHMFPVQPQNSPVAQRPPQLGFPQQQQFGQQPLFQNQQQAGFQQPQQQQTSFSTEFQFDMAAQQQPQARQTFQPQQPTFQAWAAPQNVGFEASPFSTPATTTQQQQGGTAQTSLDRLMEAQLNLK